MTGTLTAKNDAYGWYVIDTSGGGRWTPSDEARSEIEKSLKPEEAAVEICSKQPMRGTWSN